MSEFEDAIRDALRSRAETLPVTADRVATTRRRVRTRKMSKIVSVSALAVTVAFGSPAVVGRLLDSTPTITPVGDGQESGEEGRDLCYDMRRPSPRGDSTTVTSEPGDPPTVARGSFGDLPWVLELQPAEQEQDFEGEEGEEDPADGEEQTPPGEIELVLKFDPDTYGAASMQAARGGRELVYSNWRLRDNSGVYMFGAVTARASEVRADVADAGSFSAELFRVWGNDSQDLNETKFFVVFLPLDARGTLSAIDSSGDVITRDDFDSSQEPDMSELQIEGVEECDEGAEHEGAPEGGNDEG